MILITVTINIAKLISMDVNAINSPNVTYISLTSFPFCKEGEKDYPSLQVRRGKTATTDSSTSLYCKSVPVTGMANPFLPIILLYFPK